MQIDEHWCKLVKIDANWVKLMKIDANCENLMQIGENWHKWMEVYPALVKWEIKFGDAFCIFLLRTAQAESHHNLMSCRLLRFAWRCLGLPLLPVLLLNLLVHPVHIRSVGMYGAIIICLWESAENNFTINTAISYVLAHVIIITKPFVTMIITTWLPSWSPNSTNQTNTKYITGQSAIGHLSQSTSTSFMYCWYFSSVSSLSHLQKFTILRSSTTSTCRCSPCQVLQPVCQHRVHVGFMLKQRAFTKQI